jgi:hypothetical protein
LRAHRYGTIPADVVNMTGIWQMRQADARARENVKGDGKRGGRR